MKSKPKLVIDTNVFIDGLLDEKISSEQIMELFYNIKVTLLFSQDTVGELVYVMKIMAKKNIRDLDMRMKFLNEIMYIFYHSKSVNTIDVSSPLSLKCDDPRDDMFLECAYHGQADYLITNDKASGMHEVKLGDTLILTSEDFMEIYNETYSH